MSLHVSLFISLFLLAFIFFHEFPSNAQLIPQDEGIQAVFKDDMVGRDIEDLQKRYQEAEAKAATAEAHANQVMAQAHSLAFPRLSPIPLWATTLHDPSGIAIDTRILQTYYYEQVLDHFNYVPESYRTFQQRYLINSKYWGGANSSAPIFACLGAEAPIDDSPQTVGFLTDNAASFNALLVYIEHRYYGESVPFGTFGEAMSNASTRGYFNSAQALADYAAVLLYIKKVLSAQNSPIIVVGGSYGGMLATWFRLKYPHIALGALASSAPILYFDGIARQAGFYDVITKDFREISDSCYQTIRKSWSVIDEVAKKPNGLSVLSKRFNTCK